MLTAAENIVLPLKLAGVKLNQEWFEELIDKVGLGDRLEHRPSELSGGQQQRVAVARALVSRPSVMFADEPTGNLDSTTSGEILALLRDSVDTLGQTTVMVTHDAHAAAIADRVLFLADGDIVRDLGPSTRARDPRDARGGDRAMIGVALKGLAGRKVRALLTAFAIVIGVSMVSGTFVLTDTMQKAFDGIFSASYDKTDAVIAGKEIVKGSTSGAATVPEPLLAKVRALPEVASAGGTLAPIESNEAKILGRDGKALGSGGAPRFGLGNDASHPQFSPLKIKTGQFAQGAEAGRDRCRNRRRCEVQGRRLHPGVDPRTEAPLRGHRHRHLRRRRFARRRDDGDLGPADRADAAAQAGALRRDLDRRQGGHVALRARPRRQAPASPPAWRSRTARSRRLRTPRNVNGIVNIIRYFLLGFGGIALFVGAFVIFNTLSITVAQRTREFATLRTLGASRKQVMRSVVLEGLVIGLLASVVGLFAGLGIAKAHERAVRPGRPPGGRPGVRAADHHHLARARHLITLVASILPARRATRVPPIAAVREGSVLPPSRFAAHSLKAAVGVVAGSVAAISVGVFASGLSAIAVAAAAGHRRPRAVPGRRAGSPASGEAARPARRAPARRDRRDRR